jgi:hypothetical protein
VARRGKFNRLVDQFVTTVEQMGGCVDPQVVAEELQTRIVMVAGQLRIKPETVLRNHIPDDWGEVAASAMMTGLQQRQIPIGPAEHLAVRVAARLQAGLGQVLIYAAANGDQQQDVPALDLHHLGEAVSGLALAITEALPDTEYVVIGADIAGWTRTALETLRDQLRAGAWTHCPCGERHGQEEVDLKVLRAVSADLLFLPPAPQLG